MERYTLVIYWDKAPIVARPLDMFKSVFTQLDDYARDYGMERHRLTHTIVPSLGHDEVEQLLKLLPRNEGCSLSKRVDPKAPGLTMWTASRQDGESFDEHTPAAALRKLLDFLGRSHKHVVVGTSDKYTQ